MGKLKTLICGAAVLLLSTSVFAKQLSFQIIQHDASSEEVTEQSLSIEDEVINSFFEQGYIVTNSPTVSSESASQDEKFYKSGIGEAFDGYSDYFVQIKVYYAPRTGTLTDNGDIEKIVWILSDAKTGIKLTNKTMENVKPIRKAADTQTVASQLVSDIYKALIANKA